MESRSKLNEALQIILDYLNETSCSDEEIKSIEAENEQLRLKKSELMSSLNCYYTPPSSTVIMSDVLTRQTTLNETCFAVKENAGKRCTVRSHEASAQISSWEQKSNELDNLITLPHTEVQKQIVEMEQKIAANRLKIIKLNQEYVELNQNQEGDEDILKLNEILKRIEKDQGDLLQKQRRESP